MCNNVCITHDTVASDDRRDADPRLSALITEPLPAAVKAVFSVSAAVRPPSVPFDTVAAACGDDTDRGDRPPFSAGTRSAVIKLRTAAATVSNSGATANLLPRRASSSGQIPSRLYAL